MGRLDTIELESGGPFNSRECLYPFAGGEVSRSLIAVADDYRRIIACRYALCHA
jgi:hypothetical protein